MSNRADNLIQAIKALAEVQKAGKTMVGREVQMTVKALMSELNIDKKENE